MTATITSDASFYTDYKIGAYAFWITTSAKRILKAGALKGDIDSSNEAEFKAIINGLHTLYNAKLGTITDIYINTDCLSVIWAIKGEKSPKWCQDLIPKYKAIVSLLGANVIIRHIHGHLHTRTPRHYVNDWCDKEAKRHAKEEIKKRFGEVKK